MSTTASNLMNNFSFINFEKSRINAGISRPNLWSILFGILLWIGSPTALFENESSPTTQAFPFAFPQTFVFNRRMRHLKLLALLLFSSYLTAQTPVEKLITEAEKSPTLEKNLRVLTGEIGGRTR
jgi:hypothetical protein